MFCQDVWLFSSNYCRFAIDNRKWKLLCYALLDMEGVFRVAGIWFKFCKNISSIFKHFLFWEGCFSSGCSFEKPDGEMLNQHTEHPLFFVPDCFTEPNKKKAFFLSFAGEQTHWIQDDRLKVLHYHQKRFDCPFFFSFVLLTNHSNLMNVRTARNPCCFTQSLSL